MSHSGWLTKHTELFLSVVEAEKSQLKAPADLVSGEGPLPVS